MNYYKTVRMNDIPELPIKIIRYISQIKTQTAIKECKYNRREIIARLIYKMTISENIRR
jgi:hypothetical protein